MGFAALAVPLWVLALNGYLVDFAPASGWLNWHQHELIFGFALAIISGFLLTAVQAWTGQPSLLGIDIATSMPSLRVIRYLDQLAEWHGYPEKIRVDNGSEFTSEVFTSWAKVHGIMIDYIKPGCPYQNAYIERFNRTYRDDVLDLYISNNLNEVKQITENWIELYNTERPHDSLNDMTPLEHRNAA